MRNFILFLSLLLLAQTGFAGGGWGYIGDTGPAGWEKNYPTCVGKAQSPIDIVKTVPDTKNKLVFHYQPADFRLDLNPHNLYAYSIATGADYLDFNGKQYQLQSFHFHVPGEHQVNGHTYAMELHLVHEDSQGETLVVGVFLQKGEANATLDQILVQPIKNRKTLTETDLTGLLPATRAYYNYSGSLTVPPCTQGLTWIVMETPKQVSQEQINFFKDHVIPANSRPVQPLDGRVILETK